MPKYRRVAPSIFVSDLERAIRFYRDVLGFSLECIDEPPRRAVVQQESAVLHLDFDSVKAGLSSTHMLVDDLDAVCLRFKEAGVTLIQPPTVQDWGLREAIVADPDGNVFELAEPVRKTGMTS